MAAHLSQGGNVTRGFSSLWLVAAAWLGAATTVAASDTEPSNATSLAGVISANDLVVLGDVKHGVAARVAFFSSEGLFAAMAAGGVRHVAIEMPRVLGRQAMGVETEADVEIFARDVIRSQRWHFIDPDNPNEVSEATQHRVATAIARQVLLARRFGLKPIFYDFNNPLGGFRTINDPVYRCLADLQTMTWVRYGLDAKVTKADRDAAIMRERFSHDDELAQHIVREVTRGGGGKLVVIPGYAHAILPGGLTERLAQRLQRRATVIGVFSDGAEESRFGDFLTEQARLLQIDLSRPPHYRYRISTNTIEREIEPQRYARLNYATERRIPAVCRQIAAMD
jgi:hypothetical protein